MAPGRTFGLTSSGKGNKWTRGNNTHTRGRGRGGWRGRGRGRGRGGTSNGATTSPASSSKVNDATADEGSLLEAKFEDVRVRDEVDEKMGFPRVSEGSRREGWLVNMHPTLVKDSEWPSGRAACDYYFIEEDGNTFKCTLIHEPYFYICVKRGKETVVEEFLLKRYDGAISRILRERKEDLKLPNHLLGHRRLCLRLVFRNVQDLLAVRRELMPLALANAKKRNTVDAYAEVMQDQSNDMNGLSVEMDVDEEGEGDSYQASTSRGKGPDKDPREYIIDIREYDVTYYLRTAIDLEIRVGLWYAVTFTEGKPAFKNLPERVKRADPVVMAYDIETTKAPLKFPDQALDQIMMISYMIDGQGFLITNREIVSEDIEDFEYTPKPGYDGPFTVFNEPDEEALIRRWFSHIQSAHPTVMATFNGDFFDFPFVCARAKLHGIDMFLETGFAKDNEDEFKSRTCVHMDCFRWVKRDSYLPQGSQGLKAVTVAKLGYNPMELDPEVMTPYASEQPQVLAQYSVSDAVATYYLYMKYVNPFIFSLCNIIPLNPDEVLRKGTGTLCETLLMVEAYRGTIIMPNRHEEGTGSTFEGHVVASETYVGGHVEALEAGVFRSDIPTHFKIDKDAIQQLIDELDAALTFCIKDESKASMDDVLNYDEVKQEIKTALELMKENNVRFDKPLIYHLDVAAMYPNIMLSNRLQPDSMVDESVCAVCDYNRPGKKCDRRMKWAWRGEFFPARRDEYNMIKMALAQESFPPKYPNGPKRMYHDLAPAEQTALLHKRLGDYSRKVYRKTKETKVVERESIVCQKENPFYTDTVRRFRDRRYEYKGLLKTWKKNLDNFQNQTKSVAEIEEAKKLIVIYDSLQLAHKCILNSFYGYVMRKGARWHSMEMAGITCLTGATIIQMARELIEKIGRPLELDTDGIWCMLPGVFPENFKFNMRDGKKLVFSYPCTMLNHRVHARFTNDQYHSYNEETGQYEIRSENSIFFELDGPYKAMILPSSKEEDKLLKKRYAVFNDDGSLAELKGFEVKRRGELQLIKIFQSEIFEKFLLGTTTEECYAAVAQVADQWLDVLYTKGSTLTDEELIDLIAENRSMSKTLAEYGGQKSTSISTARRLAEFLGDQMVKDKGLACKFILSAKPMGSPITDRAIPVAIFHAEESVKRTYLRKWLKDNSLSQFDLRSILDWNYYIERLGSVIQKLITIPAAMQKVANPVPRVAHPDWLHRRVVAKEDKFQQHKMTEFFKSAPVHDMEDFGSNSTTRQGALAVARRKRRATPEPDSEGSDEEQLETPPNPLVDYSGWLRAMRPRWKMMREARMGGNSGNVVPAMFRGVKVKPIARDWDIVQIRQGRGVGRFIMWVSIEDNLTAIPLRIPREFYINFKSLPKNAVFMETYTHELVTKTLPHNRPCGHLVKITVSEYLYREEESHFINLTNNPNVDTVYERQMPLLVRALLKLGSRCSLERPGEITLSRARDQGLDILQVDRSPPSKRPYLDSREDMKILFLFHSSSSSNSIHVFALFSPAGTLRVFIIDPSSNRQSLPSVQEVYSDFWKKRPTDETLFDPTDSLQVETSHHTNESAAHKAISRELASYEARSYSLVIGSNKELSYFEYGIQKLEKFPVLLMSGPKSSHVLDTLMWQSHVVRKMLSRYLYVGPWLYILRQKSIYYDIPIGNLEGDPTLFCADIDFARRIQKQDMVLWWSPLPKPDFGGLEDQNSVCEEVSNPEVTHPGCYSNVSIKVSIHNLAVNSVLQSSLLNELEGSGGATAFDTATHNLDDYSKGIAQPNVTMGESSMTTQVFSVLRSMVKSWLIDAYEDPEGPAARNVEHFWRWLCASGSNMHDPNLPRFVRGLMKKNFFQLLSEFKRLGSNIVHADFSSILIVTSKPPGAAYAYATYITTAVTSHELFQHIVLRNENFYDFLLFMDYTNFCGVVCEKPEELPQPEEDRIFPLQTVLNIARFLPPALQDVFLDAIRFFVAELASIKMKNNDHARTPLKVIQNLSSDFMPSQDASKQKEIEDSRTFITQRLTRRLLQLTQRIINQHQDAAMEGLLSTPHWRFPTLPGSHLNLTDPPLEFVKFLCAALSPATKEFGIELGILRRNLLELVGVKEFSDKAKFRDPCESLKLPMVVCESCDEVRDFDFCRDPELIPTADPDGNPMMAGKWQPTCSSCDAAYSKLSLELSLINLLDTAMDAYTSQDLTCKRCKSVMDTNLAMRCLCAGNWEGRVSKSEVKKKVLTVEGVAKFCGMDRARVYAQGLLGLL